MAFRTWAGPREQQPWGRYPNIVSLRTLVWFVGLVSFVLNLLALAKLDFLNVLLLLPSLLFSVSCLVGPFLMQPKPGRALGNLVWLPKTLGWVAGGRFYIAIAWAGVLARMVRGPGGRLSDRNGRLVDLPGSAVFLLSVEDEEAVSRRWMNGSGGIGHGGCSRHPHGLVQQCAVQRRHGTRPPPSYGKQGLTEEQVQTDSGVFCRQGDSVDQAAAGDTRSSRRRESPGRQRIPQVSDLSLFTFIWFLFVPVTGFAVVFSTGSYRFSLICIK